MIFHNIDNVKIPFDSNWKQIAVSISGGADSTLLAYLLCSIIQEQNLNVVVNCISHIRMWKTRPWQQDDSLSIFNQLSIRFPNIEFIRHTNFIAPELEYGNMGANLTDEYGKQVSGDNIQQRAYAEYICYKYNIDAYFNGVTRNPRLANFNGMVERDLDPTDNNQHLYIMKHMDRYAVHPFRFVEKDWVVKQYKRLDLLDLFDMTRSCEGEFDGINYLTYISGKPVPVCGKCFWCKERKWAYDKA